MSSSSFESKGSCPPLERKERESKWEEEKTHHPNTTSKVHKKPPQRTKYHKQRCKMHQNALLWSFFGRQSPPEKIKK